MASLESKVAIVTGAAQGIGRACAIRLAADGAKVVVADIQVEKGKELAAELGDSALFHELNVASEEQWATAIATTVEKWGKLDIVVHNAAVVTPASAVQDTTNEEFDLLIDVNIRGIFFGCKLAYPELKKSKGCIVSIASMAGVSGQLEHAVYGATKGAVNALTKCMAVDWAPDGIRVNSICPACVRTEAMERYVVDLPDPEEELQKWANIHLIKRLTDPAEIAAVVSFLSGDDASFITGSNMPVSGGSECGYKLPQ